MYDQYRMHVSKHDDIYNLRSCTVLGVHPAGSLHVIVGTHARPKFHGERESFVGYRHGPWISEKGGVFQHDLHEFHKKGCHVF